MNPVISRVVVNGCHEFMPKARQQCYDEKNTYSLLNRKISTKFDTTHQILNSPQGEFLNSKVVLK